MAPANRSRLPSETSNIDPQAGETLRQRLTIVVLVAIVFFGWTLRRWHANDSLWIDELHTAWTVQDRWEEVAPRALYGNQSPLYFWIEWIAVQISGRQELSYRAISLFSGTALIVAAYYLAYCLAEWLGGRLSDSLSSSTPVARGRSYLSGLLAAWLVAWDPLLIFYAQEARPYALVQLFVVLQMLCTLSWLHSPTRTKLILSLVLASVSTLLHPTAALQFVPAFLLAVWYGWKNPTTGRPALGLALAAVVFTLALLYPVLLRAFSHRQDWSSFIDKPTLLDFLQLLPGTALALFSLTYLLVEFFRRRTRRLANGDSQELGTSANLLLGTVVAWLLIPLVAVWILSISDVARLWSPRYVAGSIPAIAVLLALATRLFPDRRFSNLAALSLAVLVPLWDVHSPARQLLRRDWQSDHKEDWRGAIERLHTLRTGNHSDVAVFVDTGLLETTDLLGENPAAIAQDYSRLPLMGPYPVGDRHNLFGLPHALPQRMTSSTWNRTRLAPRVFLLTRSSPARGERVASQFAARWKEDFANLKVYRHFSSSGVQLYRLEIGRPQRKQTDKPQTSVDDKAPSDKEP